MEFVCCLGESNVAMSSSSRPGRAAWSFIASKLSAEATATRTLPSSKRSSHSGCFAKVGKVALIDEVEVGRRVSPRIRVAFEVVDAERVAHDLVASGAELIAEPTVTPWQSVNARLSAPAGLQITVFQELAGAPDRPVDG